MSAATTNTQSPVAIKRTHGPKGGLILGSLRPYKRDRLEFFLEMGTQYPDIVRMRLAHMAVFLVTSPDYIKHILQDHRQNYAKGVSYDALRTVLGNGLLVADGEFWLRQRRMIQPFFKKAALVDKIPIIASSVQRLSDAWDARAQSGEQFDLVRDMMTLAFDVVGRSLVGADIVDEMLAIESVLDELGEWVYHRIENPVALPPGFPTPSNRRFRKQRQVLYDVVDRVIAKRKQMGPARDLLSALLQARDDETNERMDDIQLRDEVLTLLLAGHETTGDALCWTWLLLDRHRDARERLHREVDEVLEDHAIDDGLLDQLTYTQSVLDESMRLYPPAWSFTRTAVEDDNIDGHPIPKGAVVVISPYVNHRLPRFWSEPATFDPDRFAPEAAAAIPRYAYFPFGGGPHACVGKWFSLYESQIALAMLARRFEIQFGPDAHDTEPLPRISLLPQSPLLVTVTRRHQDRT